MADKLPFRLKIHLEGYRPEAVHAALNHLDTLCGEYDHAPELKATATIESNDEAALTAIRAQLEVYLRANKTLVEGKVTMEAPLVRPKPETQPLPMAPYFQESEYDTAYRNADDDEVLEIRGR